MAIKSFEFLNTPLISTNPANGFTVDYMKITADVPDGATFIHTSNVTQIIANGKYYDGMMGQLENWTATGLDSSYLVAGNVFAIEGNYLKTIPNSTAKLSFNWNFGFGGGTGAFMGPYLSADAYDPTNNWNRITLSSGYIALDIASSPSPTGTIVSKILRLDNGKKRSVDLTQDTLKMTTFTVDGYARYNGSTSGYVDLKAPTTVGSSGSATILAQQLSTPNSAYFWWDGGPTYAPQGQTFSLASSATLDKISLYLFKGETITSGTISVSLYATSGGLPTGAALATSASMNATLLTNSTAEYEFTFTPGVSIAASTTYAFVVEAAGMAGSMGMGFPGVYVSLDYAGTYASGEALYWNGSTWATTGTSDLAFKLAESGPIEPSSWTFTLPANDGNANQFLQTNGSGVTSWTTIPTPTLQSVYEAGNAITTSAGKGDIAITGTQKLSITKADSSDAFFAGTDSNSRLIINYQGAIDQVSNHGSIPSGSFRNMGGPVLRLQGNNSYYVDINPGLPSASYTLTLPADDGQLDMFLQTNGSGVLTWAAAAKLDLSNLNSTAINQSLIPDSSADQDVGSSSLQWRDVFASSGLKVATTGGVENIAAASTLNIGSAGNTDTLNVGTGSGTNTINIGTGAGTTTINLGGAGDTVNIAGTLAYVNTTNLEVADKLVVVNKGGAAASGNASGIAIQENGILEGYAYVGNTRASWDFVAPASNGTFRLTPHPTYVANINTANLSMNRTYTLPDASGTLIIAASGILSLANGGTNKALTASSGTIAYSDTDSLELSTVGSTGQPLLSGGAGAPTWFTSSGVVKATSGVLSTANTISLTTEVTNALPLANGGTNKNLTASAGAVVYSDVDSFELTSVGTSGQVLKSNGSSALAFADPDKLFVTLTNSSGSNIGAGNVVASSQVTANTIIRADATSLDTCEAVIGIAVAAIPNGSSGLIQISGRCTTIARDEAFDIGRTVYVSENVGKATKTAPSSSGSVIYSLGIADSTTSVLLRPRLRAVNSGTPLPNPPFVAVSLNDELGGLATYLRSYSSEFRNPNFYPYSLDGTEYFINDGGGDMYDNGNYTLPWLISGIDYSTYNYSPNSGAELSYNNTSPTTVDTSFQYVSFGYEQQGWGQATLTTVHPLTLLGTRNTVGTPVGFQKAGNSGADGGGTLASGYIYENADIDGFTVYAWMRQTYNAGDPSHCDLYILIGHPAWESVFGTVSAYAHPVTFGGNGGYLYTSGPGVQNILAIATLLSKSSGVLVTNADCETVVQNYVNRIKLYFNL